NKGSKSDLQAYRHTKYFAEAVREARQVRPNLDKIFIFTCTCQSPFETFIDDRASFASSTVSVNSHALYSLCIAEKLGYTSFMDKVSVWEVLRNTLTGEKGMGGIETRGLLRTGMPYVEESESPESE